LSGEAEGLTEMTELIASLPILLERLKNADVQNLSEAQISLYFDSLSVMIQSGGQISIEDVAQAIDLLRDMTAHLFEIVNALTAELKEVKKKLERLEQLEANLLIGQIANSVEKEIVGYVLKDCPGIDKRYITIYQLDVTLFSPSNHQSIRLSDDKIEAAKKRWSNLDQKIKPLRSRNLYGMIQNFKYQRNVHAHPDFNIETVSDELDKLPLDERTRDDCSQLLEILPQLANLQ